MQNRFITDVWTNLGSANDGEIAGLRVTIPESFLDKADVLAKALSCADMHVATQDSNNTGFEVSVMVYDVDDDDNEVMVEDEKDGNPTHGQVYVTAQGSVGVGTYSKRHFTKIECVLGKIEDLRLMFS